ncbi:hypothetical protein BC834DRAFT_967219 [Gloeopeniophorella convolvens]|nr:hypothetical protein BC834DRAFT_967219 [Gloeopeniophorella convolvens]
MSTSSVPRAAQVQIHTVSSTTNASPNKATTKPRPPNFYIPLTECLRIAVACVRWGTSVAFVQVSDPPACRAPGTRVWRADPTLLCTIAVADFGPHPAPLVDYSAEPPEGTVPGLVVHGAPGGQVAVGYRVPWYHKVLVGRREGIAPWGADSEGGDGERHVLVCSGSQIQTWREGRDE